MNRACPNGIKAIMQCEMVSDCVVTVDKIDKTKYKKAVEACCCCVAVQRELQFHAQPCHYQANTQNKIALGFRISQYTNTQGPHLER